MAPGGLGLVVGVSQLQGVLMGDAVEGRVANLGDKPFNIVERVEVGEASAECGGVGVGDEEVPVALVMQSRDTAGVAVAVKQRQRVGEG